MPKNYTVRVIGYATVLVIGAKDEDEAMEVACDDVNMGDLQLDEGRIHSEVTNEQLPRCKVHSDAIVDLTD